MSKTRCGINGLRHAEWDHLLSSANHSNMFSNFNIKSVLTNEQRYNFFCINTSCSTLTSWLSNGNHSKRFSNYQVNGYKILSGQCERWRPAVWPLTVSLGTGNYWTKFKQRGHKILSRKSFEQRPAVCIDLWPHDLKISSVHTLTVPRLATLKQRGQGYWGDNAWSTDQRAKQQASSFLRGGGIKMLLNVLNLNVVQCSLLFFFQ